MRLSLFCSNLTLDSGSHGVQKFRCFSNRGAFLHDAVGHWADKFSTVFGAEIVPCFGSGRCHVDNKKEVEQCDLLARGLERKAVGQTVVKEGLGKGLADGLDAYARPPRSLREPTRGTKTNLRILNVCWGRSKALHVRLALMLRNLIR